MRHVPLIGCALVLSFTFGSCSAPVQPGADETFKPYDKEEIFADPTSPKTGRPHVPKGGRFVADVKDAIPATHRGGPGSGFDVGFRIAR